MLNHIAGLTLVEEGSWEKIYFCADTAIEEVLRKLADAREILPYDYYQNQEGESKLQFFDLREKKFYTVKVKNLNLNIANFFPAFDHLTRKDHQKYHGEEIYVPDHHFSTHLTPLDCYNPSGAYLSFALKDEYIQKVHCETGFSEVGMEEIILKKKNLKDVFAVLEHFVSERAIFYQYSLVKSLEVYFGVKPSHEAGIIRNYAMELARVVGHFRVVLNLCCYLKLEKIVKEVICCLDGVEREFKSLLQKNDHLVLQKESFHTLLSSEIIPKWEKIKMEIEKDQRFYLPLQGSKFLKDQMIKAGVTGVALRASGVNFDLREGPSDFHELPLKINTSVGSIGCLWDFFSLKMQEIDSSLRFCRKVYNLIPSGYILDLYPHHLEVYFKDFEPRTELPLMPVESADGLVSVQLTINHVRGEVKFSNVRIRSSSSFHLQFLTDWWVKKSYRDVVLSQHLFDLNSLEVDR
jgi:NADH:ubiquinone oxidoreductase subunit D